MTIDGVRYSHIVDPRSGLGLTGRSAVAVVASRGATADVAGHGGQRAGTGPGAGADRVGGRRGGLDGPGDAHRRLEVGVTPMAAARRDPGGGEGSVADPARQGANPDYLFANVSPLSISGPRVRLEDERRMGRLFMKETENARKRQPNRPARRPRPGRRAWRRTVPRRPRPPAPRAPAALERFKALAGEWVAAEDGEMTKKGDLVARYAVTAGGSAVVETVFPGSPHEMVTVYHADGPDLVLTHYCVEGNQPRMRARGGQRLALRVQVRRRHGHRSPPRPPHELGHRGAGRRRRDPHGVDGARRRPSRCWSWSRTSCARRADGPR